MSKIRFNIALSLDGYMAGPDQSRDNPLGVGGLALHDWVFPLAAFRAMHGETGGEINASTQVIEQSVANAGAYVMGRNMFGGRDPAWRGWWGDNPPYHAAVFVVTHEAREPLVMQGGTTFHFITGGIAPALAQARDAAGGKDIVLAGGASLIRQCLAAGVVDEVNLSIAPLVLGAGERLFVDLPALKLEQVRAIDAPNVTHIKYRVVRS